MGSLSPIHWLIVVLVLVVLFGAKRLPDASRSIGRRTSSSTERHAMPSQSRSSSCGPFTAMVVTPASAAVAAVAVPNLSASAGALNAISPKTHLAHVSNPSGPGAPGIRPVIRALR